MPMVCEPWPVDLTCLPKDWSTDDTEWDGAQRQAVEVASEILKRFSGGVYGLCALKIRPCRTRGGCRGLLDVSVEVGSSSWSPALIDGRMYNIACGCSGQCGCSPLSEIILNPAAYDILAVKVDGVVLPSTAYRVDDRRRLVRLDGLTWPDCQELALPDTEPGTFSVSYRTGNAVPAGGRMAVTDLAGQLWKACQDRKNCSLPERVTSVVREGITYTLLDNLDVFERGRTGLSRVDMWLASVNPYSARGSMAVYSPDTVRARRETWPTEDIPVPPDPGPGGSYVYVQSVAAAVWTIVHPLGFRPGGVQVLNSLGQEVVGEVTYPDINTVRIAFSGPVAGTAYLS
jgi:hypothetical protein